MKNRIYAAFDHDGLPAYGVWGFDRESVETFCSDRTANGEALPGEHVRAMKIDEYSKRLTSSGFPGLHIAYKIDVAETIRLLGRKVLNLDHLR
jgi:hypothetical protein